MMILSSTFVIDGVVLGAAMRVFSGGVASTQLFQSRQVSFAFVSSMRGSPYFPNFIPHFIWEGWDFSTTPPPPLIHSSSMGSTHTFPPASGNAVVLKQTLPDRCRGRAVVSGMPYCRCPAQRHCRRLLVFARIYDADGNANAERHMSEIGKALGILPEYQGERQWKRPIN